MTETAADSIMPLMVEASWRQRVLAVLFLLAFVLLGGAGRLAARLEPV